MAVFLEDNFADVVGKAQRGLKLSDSELSSQAGVFASELSEVRAGRYNQAVLRRLAPVLGLNAEALVGLPNYLPCALHLDGLAAFSTPWDEMMVNSYLVTDFSSGEAVAFDTGADCTPMLGWLRKKGLTLSLLLLTHKHGDHIFDMDTLQERTGAKVFVSDREPLEGAESFKEGRKFECGRLRIETRLTWGHSKGGITYVVHGLESPLAVVGDAMFAGSMGGGMVSYTDALRTNREQILTLPPKTVLCPGHGPLTTVREELLNNPFFA